MADELTRADLERVFAADGWVFTLDINNHPAARRVRTSPAVWLIGRDWADLRDQIIRYIGGERSWRLAGRVA